MSVKSPYSTKAGKVAYSGIVYIEGDNCVGEDYEGNIISERAKSDYVSEVIQAVTDEVVQGRIYIKNVGEEYIIKSALTSPGGLSFVSDGAELNLENLNSTVLTIGSDAAMVSRQLTEISGFKLTGATANLNTLFVKASNLSRGLIMRDIVYLWVNNVIDVRGNSYSAELSNICGGHIKGTVIKFTSLDSEGYAPSQSQVLNCENSNGSATAGLGKGVEILASNSVAAEGIAITNSWFEQMDSAIYNEGRDTRIGNNILSANATAAVYNHDQGVNVSSGIEYKIFNNRIVTTVSTQKGIIIAGKPNANGQIASNFFRVADGIAINSEVANITKINNNIFKLEVADSKGIGGASAIEFADIRGNSFIGAIGTPRGLGVNASCNYLVISQNTFIGVLYWVYHGGITNCLIRDNNVYTITNLVPNLGSGNTLLGNKGYVTENTVLSPAFAIDSTGTKEVTIAHGLDITPAVKDCQMSVIEDTDVDDWECGPLVVISANATNVIAHVKVSVASGTGLATAKLGLRVGDL